jgi:hypothetical protein
MIEVPAIPRSEIDAWPLPEAGLPPRVVNGATLSGIVTVGELRALSPQRVAALPGIGRRSKDAIEAFLFFSRRLTTGEVRFSTVDSLLRQLMHAVEYRTLALRYGLNLRSSAPGKWPATLRAVGEELRVTRERARQLIERAKTRLGSRLGQACLRRVYSDFLVLLDGKRGAATPGDVRSHSHPAYMARTDPYSLLRLLCDCACVPNYRHGFFTALPALMPALETHSQVHFQAHPGPVGLGELIAALPLPQTGTPHATVEHVLRTLLTHVPWVAATIDDRYFVPEAAAPALLREMFNGNAEPLHYRTLVRQYNALMCPGSRKGTGFILDVLRHSGRFSCVSPGTYKPLPPETPRLSAITEGLAPCA